MKEKESSGYALRAKCHQAYELLAGVCLLACGIR